MTKLFYRFRDADIDEQAEQLGFNRMLGIPPDKFLDRSADPHKPSWQQATETLQELEPVDDDIIEWDVEDFHALERASGFQSCMYRVGLLRLVHNHYPNIPVCLYGTPRLISGEDNQFMELLGQQVDLSGVVNYRKCTTGGQIHNGGMPRSQSNLEYAGDFNKPIIVTIGAMMRDKNKVFHRMSPEEWTQTIENITEMGIPVWGWYCWSSAASLVANSPHRLAEAWTPESINAYLAEFLQHTKETVAGLGGEG